MLTDSELDFIKHSLSHTLKSYSRNSRFSVQERIEKSNYVIQLIDKLDGMKLENASHALVWQDASTHIDR